ncbi:LOW QUALITY PROTEIN: pre-mRNA-splicing factor SLU7-like [Pomacea canaliculata]|uniref:LOW QUALITY PROTEIN: pre-mRNA-splicing factor SLU7-like n=1 Tax=Pomacea canaliculata TaxID=400727 RepID=UPI000D726745|nr:LOW QUALITY PROTEIN: pre-mRNA-splicing factor SLU7-like [Pomacea canaliculata]
MTFRLNLPPSEIARLARSEQSAGYGEIKKQSREGWKKMKELEEARKAGTAPAMKDEKGKDINPHIPQYIMQAPWYIGAKTPTLRHQRQQPLRRRTSKYGFESKRDNWSHVDADEHLWEVFEKFKKLERVGDDSKYTEDMDMPGQKFETKQRFSVRNLRIREDTAKYLFNLDLNSAHYDPKTRSMRDNPFQGSGKDAIIETLYIGENAVRLSGDAEEFARKQLFAWEAYEKGTDVHLQADPTKLELLHKEFLQRRDTFKQTAKDSVLDRYGGHEHLEAPPKQLCWLKTISHPGNLAYHAVFGPERAALYAIHTKEQKPISLRVAPHLQAAGIDIRQEDYVEYSRHGTVIKGQEKADVKSRYEEDVFPNNHQSVWGSFWRDGRWGYKCCYSLVEESYCTGKAGIVAEQESIGIASHLSVEQGTVALRETSTDDQPDKQEKKKKNKDKKKKKRKHRYSSEDESDEEKKKKRLKKALEKKRMTELLQIDERNRPYNSMCDVRATTE